MGRGRSALEDVPDTYIGALRWSPSVEGWEIAISGFIEGTPAYRFTHRSIKRLVREWSEVIERDISHPCIVIWVPFNESWRVPELSAVSAHRDAVAALYHLTKTLDASRLVIGNDGWESSATDVIGIHDYDIDPQRMRERYGPAVTLQEVVDRRWAGGRILTLDGYPHRGQPICLSEFGGVALLAAQREASAEH